MQDRAPGAVVDSAVAKISERHRATTSGTRSMSPVNRRRAGSLSRVIVPAVNRLARLLLLGAIAHGGACGSVSGGVADAGHPASDGGGSGSAIGVPFGPYKDVGIFFNTNTNAISSMLSGAEAPIATELAANHATAVTLAFATGACGSERWASTDGATLGQINAPLLDGAGIDYTLATGGAAGIFTCASDTDFATFVDRWKSPHLVGVDFDIESTQTPAQITDLVRRIAPAHATHPGLRFSLTLATLANTDGGESLNATGLVALQALHAELGTIPSYVTINLMTMNYGSASPSVCVVAHGACDMGASAVQAAHNLQASHGIPLANIEITPMIGGNNVQSDVFVLTDVATVASFAGQLAGVHFWAYDRDTDCDRGPASPTCNSLGGAGVHGFLHRFQAAGL